MTLKAGDWVIINESNDEQGFKEGDVGQIQERKSESGSAFKRVMVRKKVIGAPAYWDLTAVCLPEQLTPITKEVADIMRSNDGQ